MRGKGEGREGGRGGDAQVLLLPSVATCPAGWGAHCLVGGAAGHGHHKRRSTPWGEQENEPSGVMGGWCTPRRPGKGTGRADNRRDMAG